MPQRKTAIRAILFDKDGTLIDFQKSWGPILRDAAMLAAQGDEAFAARLMALGGMNPQSLITAADTVFAAGNTEDIARLFIEAGARFEVAPLITALDALFIAGADHGVAVTDLAELFLCLRDRGFRLGIASSDSEEAIWRLVRKQGLVHLVDFVCGYDTGFGHKPEAGMALGFAQKIAHAPDEIAMVGDNLSDMRMGCAAGCGLNIAVLTGTGTAQTLGPEADAVLPSIADLPAFFG